VGNILCSFTYTNAAIYAALMEASALVQTQSKSRRLKYEARAKWIKQKTIKTLWLNDAGCFAKGIIDKKVYPVIDASIIGTFTPFNMLDMNRKEEREKIIQMLNTIETRLNYWVQGKKGIKRYEDDEYIGGNPWIVTTLWLIKAQLSVAEYYLKKGDKVGGLWVNKTLPYFGLVLKGTTSTKLLPEQVDAHTGNPAWAIPLGWSCALFIDAMHQLTSILK
jgi:GH15 family glucan-1,4-alpha-glucosidase